MYINNYRRIVLVLFMTAVVIQLMLPVGVFATQEDGAGEKITVTQEFTYKAGGEPNIPERISQFGQTLTLVSVSEPVESSTLPETRTYTTRVSATYTPGQLAQAPPNAKLTPVYGTATRQVDRKEKIKDLPDNDVDRLPKRKVYEDTNGRGPGAKVQGDLALAEVRYEVSGRDRDGLPNKYTAHVFYRGEETYTVLLYYTSEETYTRKATEGGVTTYTVVATYEGFADADESVDEDADGSANDGADDDAGDDADMSDYVPVDADADSGAGDGSSDGSDAGLAADSGDSGFGDGEGTPVISDAAEPPVDSGSGFGFSLAGLSPIGIATLAMVVAAVVMLVFLGVFNRRKVHEAPEAP